MEAIYEHFGASVVAQLPGAESRIGGGQPVESMAFERVCSIYPPSASPDAEPLELLFRVSRPLGSATDEIEFGVWIHGMYELFALPRLLLPTDDSSDYLRAVTDYVSSVKSLLEERLVEVVDQLQVLAAR